MNPSTTRSAATPRRSLTVALVVLLVGTLALAVGLAVRVLAPTDSATAAGLTADDGVIPDDRRISVHDVDVPAVGRLDPDLLAAMQRAADDAAAEGVAFHVTSGWRSEALQAALLRDAVYEYGSEAEAARWVAPPQTSAHVSGDAIDIGDFDATYWLGLNGAAYGLCQVYANEPWHFELRPDAATQGCPEQYLDPTHDPRLQS